ARRAAWPSRYRWGILYDGFRSSGWPDLHGSSTRAKLALKIMPLLNYTTEVSAERSVAEIQSKLAKAGAWSILHEYQRGTGELIGLSFQIDTQFGPMAFRLPANIDAVAKILTKQRVRHRPDLKPQDRQ